MCGIVGIFSYNNNALPDKAIIRKMAGSISHRGPDDEGIYYDDHIALGFRRLSIIDIETGSQPIHNEDKEVWTVFNGEIYNYQELRAFLEKKDHCFYTNTDTEVLVHLYEEYGDEMVHHLRGMFAFCIWDKRSKRLCIFRDRIGIKPLFYAEAGGFFLFASEMKAILASGLIPKELNHNALNHYLGLQYIPAPLTIYKDIYKLKPAHKLIVSSRGSLGKGSIEKTSVQEEYWDINDIPLSTMSFEDCKDRYYELLVESVKLHLRSDVPLGAFLSGGVDSSAVVAIMSELCTTPVNTFTISHSDRIYDESEYARQVSERFGTVHKELTIEPSDFLSLVPSVIEQYDEPFADSSALPTYMVSMLARKHVKVVLSGDGGDETCAGYARYAKEMHFAKIAKMLKPGDILPASIKNTLYGRISFNHSLANKATKYILNILSTDSERHLFFMSYFRKKKMMLYTDAFRKMHSATDDIAMFDAYMNRIKGDDILQKILYLDQKTYLPDDILYKVDIASMANSLEVRVPLLDHKLVEFIAGIPTQFKLGGGIGKAIFKKMFEDKLPHDVLYRKKKGFEIPVSTWFRNELAGYIKDVLLSSSLLREPYFDRKFIEKMIVDHQKGSQDFGPHLWILMSLSIWHHKHGASVTV